MLYILQNVDLDVGSQKEFKAKKTTSKDVVYAIRYRLNRRYLHDHAILCLA